MHIKLFVLLNIFFNPLQEVAFKISLSHSYVCEERNYKGVIQLACGIDPWKTQRLTASEERSWMRHEPGWLSGIAKGPGINFCVQNQQGPYMIGMTIIKDTISSEDHMDSMKSLKNQHWPCTIEMSINKEMFGSYEVASKNSLKNHKWPYMIEMIIDNKMTVSNEVISKEFLNLCPYDIGMAINKEMIVYNDVASKESLQNQQWPNTIEMTINKEMIVYDKGASKDYLKWCAKTFNDWKNPTPLINLNGSQVQNNENSLTLWNESLLSTEVSTSAMDTPEDVAFSLQSIILETHLEVTKYNYPLESIAFDITHKTKESAFSAGVSPDAIDTPEEVAFSLQSIILETHPEVTIFDHPLETMAFDTTQENKETAFSVEVSPDAIDTPEEVAFSLQSIILDTHPEMTIFDHPLETMAFDTTQENKESTSFPAEVLTSVMDSLEDSLSLKPVTLKINPEVNISSKLVEKPDINKTKEDNQTSSRMDNLPIVRQPTSSTPVVMLSRRDPPSCSKPSCFGCCPYSKSLDY